MITGPDAFHVIAQRIKTAVKDRLSDEGQPVERAVIMPAQIAWDACECGTLSIATRQVFPTNDFPNDIQQQLNCKGGLRAAEYVIQVMRCAPQPTSTNSLFPTIEQNEASALEIEKDAFWLNDAVFCLLTEMMDEDIVDFRIMPLGYAGPQGACVGSELHALVATDNR